MNKTILYLTVVLLITLFSGCQTSPNKQMMEKDGHILITSDNFNHIAGIQWILQEMTVEDSNYPLAGERPFVKFETDGKINGFASVNRFFGSVQVDDKGLLKWSPMGSTRMAGPEELMNQEDAFLKALPKTEQLSVKGIHLYAYSFDRQTELVFYVPVK